MTHYEQCCARECPDGCGKNLVRFPVGPEHAVHRYYNSEIVSVQYIPCTAPTLAEFAERCAGALTQIAKPALGGKQQQLIARRALGLEK